MASGDRAAAGAPRRELRQATLGGAAAPAAAVPDPRPAADQQRAVPLRRGSGSVSIPSAFAQEALPVTVEVKVKVTGLPPGTRDEDVQPVFAVAFQQIQQEYKRAQLSAALTGVAAADGDDGRVADALAAERASQPFIADVALYMRSNDRRNGAYSVVYRFLATEGFASFLCSKRDAATGHLRLPPPWDGDAALITSTATSATVRLIQPPSSWIVSRRALEAAMAAAGISVAAVHVCQTPMGNAPAGSMVVTLTAPPGGRVPSAITVADSGRVIRVDPVIPATVAPAAIAANLRAAATARAAAATAAAAATSAAAEATAPQPGATRPQHPTQQQREQLPPPPPLPPPPALQPTSDGRQQQRQQVRQDERPQRTQQQGLQGERQQELPPPPPLPGPPPRPPATTVAAPDCGGLEKLRQQNLQSQQWMRAVLEREAREDMERVRQTQLLRLKAKGPAAAATADVILSPNRFAALSEEEEARMTDDQRVALAIQLSVEGAGRQHAPSRGAHQERGGSDGAGCSAWARGASLEPPPAGAAARSAGQGTAAAASVSAAAESVPRAAHGGGARPPPRQPAAAGAPPRPSATAGQRQPGRAAGGVAGAHGAAAGVAKRPLAAAPGATSATLRHAATAAAPAAATAAGPPDPPPAPPAEDLALHLGTFLSGRDKARRSPGGLGGFLTGLLRSDKPGPSLRASAVFVMHHLSHNSAFSEAVRRHELPQMDALVHMILPDSVAQQPAATATAGPVAPPAAAPAADTADPATAVVPATPSASPAAAVALQSAVGAPTDVAAAAAAAGPNSPRSVSAAATLAADGATAALPSSPPAQAAVAATVPPSGLPPAPVSEAAAVQLAAVATAGSPVAVTAVGSAGDPSATSASVVREDSTPGGAPGDGSASALLSPPASYAAALLSSPSAVGGGSPAPSFPPISPSPPPSPRPPPSQQPPSLSSASASSRQHSMALRSHSRPATAATAAHAAPNSDQPTLPTRRAQAAGRGATGSSGWRL